MDISLVLLAGISSAFITFYLNNRLQMGGVMASSLVSLIPATFFYIFPEILNNYLTENLPLIYMGGSFIGMATSRIISHYWIIGLSGLFFSGIYLCTGSFFDGFGGSLGTTAAISLGATYSLKQFRNTI